MLLLYNNNGIFYGGGVFLHKGVSITFTGHSQITFMIMELQVVVE